MPAKRPKTDRAKPISAHGIDVFLLSFASGRWQKVAKIIENTLWTCDNQRLRVSAKAIDMRMAVLVRNGRLEAKGNIKHWRYSEVRLPLAIGTRALSDNP